MFDLAGITCGHFLVPFWTFFGATLIGKAVIKMLIQKVFVIIAFNEMLVERAVAALAYIPAVGPKLQEPFKHFLVNQKMKLRRKPGEEVPMVCIIMPYDSVSYLQSLISWSLVYDCICT